MDCSFVAVVPDIYGWHEWQTWLTYLPRGASIRLGNYFTGKLLDHNYRNVARSIGRAEHKASVDELLDFPIEKPRTRGSFAGLAISTVTMVGYGWTLHQRSHSAVVLAL